MPYLFHSNPHEVRLLDCEGRTYVIPPHKAWSVPALEGTDITGPQGQPAYRSFTIPAEKMAKHFLAEGQHFGLVMLEEKITDNGITFDLKEATERSAKARFDDQSFLLDRWVQTAHDNELKKEPVRPPEPVIQAILTERGLDLQKDFGITPVGYKVSEYASARDEKMKTLEAKTNAQEEKIAELTSMLQRTLELVEEGRKKGKSNDGKAAV
jgi:hypothetical protein